MQVLFVLFFCRLFFLYGGNTAQILYTSAITIIFASFIGIINSILIKNFELYLFKSIIPDRVQFYGIILLIVSYISIHFTQKIENSKNFNMLILAFIIGIIAIFMCEKRTLILGLLTFFLYAIFIFRSNLGSKLLMSSILVLGVFMLPFVVDFDSTFNRGTDEITG